MSNSFNTYTRLDGTGNYVDSLVFPDTPAQVIVTDVTNVECTISFPEAIGADQYALTISTYDDSGVRTYAGSYNRAPITASEAVAGLSPNTVYEVILESYDTVALTYSQSYAKEIFCTKES